MDSIMASPTNKVRVIVAEASGCCASELKAVETARPSPSAGPMLPSAMVRPAVMIETTAMIVMLSIILSFGWFVIETTAMIVMLSIILSFGWFVIVQVLIASA